MQEILSVFTKANVLYMLKGLVLTLEVSVTTILLSLIFGTVLAMARNYCKGKLKIISLIATVYIEIFRCTPNLLWIYFMYFEFRGSQYFIGTMTFTVFTSAVVAEIIRGGFNAIPKGQFEGAYSQGFNFFQTMWYIILPQTYKNIIPALLSQMTTVIKDTCFLRAVAITEFMWQSMVIVGQYCDTLVKICGVFAFMALVYFLINFALSLAVRAYQKKIAVS